ncbi:MAG: hypothetical protein U0S36_04000 [Candidatus Nanopelagicales bacterium]
MSTLAKVLVVVGLLAVAGYDSVVMTINSVSIMDQAQAAAQIGHQVLHDRQDPQAAYNAVVRYAKENGLTVVPQSFAVSSRSTVTVEVRREAPTIAAHHLPKVSTYVVATAVGTASDPVP